MILFILSYFLHHLPLSNCKLSFRKCLENANHENTSYKFTFVNLFIFKSIVKFLNFLPFCMIRVRCTFLNQSWYTEQVVTKSWCWSPISNHRCVQGGFTSKPSSMKKLLHKLMNLNVGQTNFLSDFSEIANSRRWVAGLLDFGYGHKMNTCN